MLFRTPRIIALPLMAAAALTAPAIGYAQAPATGTAAVRSSLPQEALLKAREAEQNLAANAPEKAIAILQELDRKYPENPAINLRLAEIHDTKNDYGPALFYYRKYVRIAGSKAREVPVGRVGTLELMAGVDDAAEKFAARLGEQTVPVATPTPRVERALLAEAKDGSRVPLTSAEQVEQIQKRGYVPPAASPTPTVTPSATPIIIPESLTKPVSPSPAAVSSAAPAPRRAEGQVQISAAAPTPKPVDEDSLLTQAFAKADSPEAVAEKLQERAATPAIQAEQTVIAPPISTPQPRQPAPLAAEMPVSAPAAVAPTSLPLAPQSAVVAYTQDEPVSNSSRGANFFSVTTTQGREAEVVIMNELKNAIVTLSIVPPDDRPVASAILAPGETKNLRLVPGKYQVSANASSNDYSPITLMSAQFDYSFAGGHKYVRRVTQSSLQQIN